MMRTVYGCGQDMDDGYQWLRTTRQLAAIGR
jgi:hypothetical protein